jgi:hypothetical protein
LGRLFRGERWQE